MQLLVQEVDNHRALLWEESKAFTERKNLASSRSWPLLMPNGRYCCGVCTSHASHFNHQKQYTSPWLMANGGVKYADRFSNKALKHEESNMHELAIELEAERALNPLEFSLQHQLHESRVITAKLFRTTLDNAIHFCAFLDFESLVCCHSLLYTVHTWCDPCVAGALATTKRYRNWRPTP